MLYTLLTKEKSTIAIRMRDLDISQNELARILENEFPIHSFNYWKGVVNRFFSPSCQGTFKPEVEKFVLRQLGLTDIVVK